jgi:hypothetical protein
MGAKKRMSFAFTRLPGGETMIATVGARLRPIPTFEPPAGVTNPNIRVPGPIPDADEAAAAPQMRAAASSALKLVSEVLENRRPPEQLRQCVSTSVLQLLRSRAQTRPQSMSLRRIGIQPAGPAKAEVWGSYAEGRRVRAFAGRVTLGRDGRWRVVTLQLM